MTDRVHREIDLANEKIKEYWDTNGREYAKINPLPDIRSVVYNRILYPIIYENEHFFYLGGAMAYILLKSKCKAKNTGKSRYYEVSPSDHDIQIGKSPIIPVGCPKYRKIIYPDDMGDLLVKLPIS